MVNRIRTQTTPKCTEVWFITHY